MNPNSATGILLSDWQVHFTWFFGPHLLSLQPNASQDFMTHLQWTISNNFFRLFMKLCLTFFLPLPLSKKLVSWNNFWILALVCCWLRITGYWKQGLASVHFPKTASATNWTEIKHFLVPKAKIIQINDKTDINYRSIIIDIHH